MDDHHIKPLFRVFLVFILLGARISEGAREFTLINYCQTTIWPAILSGDNSNGDGLALKAGQSVVFTLPDGWKGRIWGRTGCNFDLNGNGSCQTGSCGSSLKCSTSGKTPATLAEFNLVPVNYYDVSLVDGFNLPITVTPVNGQGNCTIVGCEKDLLDNCPSELSIKDDSKTVGCRNACDMFDTDEYCCRGAYSTSDTCPPTNYSKLFKKACPTAYSYAYDDSSSLFTCSDADYVISFCTKSGKNERVCTYHINRLICSGSLRRASTRKWLVVLLLSFVSLCSSLLL
ncbi:pathogenesis-related protein 5-like isoform X2 [Canna indica]|uniref:Pathogenesis-related protein 5-like isoform X2 n=1 Tax=Canna indica TaxID=4628 RepID=A0AAQ3QJZ8_9LILI|nr:pathogenesis-related protein 5-like isoform X2 [Canna indica]